MRYVWQAVVLTSAAVLGGCNEGVFDPRGPIAVANRQILLNSLGIMLAIVIPVIVATLGVAFWFRASNNRARYRPDFEYSGRLEMLVWSIPAMTVFLVGGVAWVGSHDMSPRKPISSTVKALRVQVVSLDWKWLFIYPQQGVATVNQLVVPAGTPVHFSITSASVFNVFFVPRLGSMIYAMPGMVSQLNLQADRPAVMFGQSAHFSGDGFSDMQFQVRSVTDAEFGAWIQTAKGGDKALDRAAYAQLARQSQNVKPYAYASVDPKLFDAVAMQHVPPGPGPEPENPSHAGREVAPGGHD